MPLSAVVIDDLVGLLPALSSARTQQASRQIAVVLGVGPLRRNAGGLEVADELLGRRRLHFDRFLTDEVTWTATASQDA